MVYRFTTNHGHEPLKIFLFTSALWRPFNWRQTKTHSPFNGNDVFRATEAKYINKSLFVTNVPIYRLETEQLFLILLWYYEGLLPNLGPCDLGAASSGHVNDNEDSGLGSS